jgi:hypothetical protein
MILSYKKFSLGAEITAEQQDFLTVTGLSISKDLLNRKRLPIS